MNIVIRANLGPEVGGGHLMRCLTLAQAAQARGHIVHFVLPEDPLCQYAQEAGFAYDTLPPGTETAADAQLTANALTRCKADWLVWDHYGLGLRWVDAVRRAAPQVRMLAMDDLDDRPLGADLVLDQTRIADRRQHGGTAAMIGPDFLLLRPEFTALRETALARSRTPVRQIMIAPGLMDAAGLAPLALDAIVDFEGQATVFMSAQSQSRAAVEARIAARADRTLALDADDMAARIADSDLCIGAAGMSSWERACLGLPSVLVTVADNQLPVAHALAENGAAVSLTLDAARDLSSLRQAIAEASARSQSLTRSASALCKGDGASRVLDCMAARLRPLHKTDAKRLYQWRMSPAIRSASLQQDPFTYEAHLAWMDRTCARTDGLWCLFEEPEPVGFVAATDQGDGLWEWSFYIGADDAYRGAGGRMLSQFLQKLWRETDCRRLRATVLKDNARSGRLHQSLGFSPAPKAAEAHCIYHLDRPPRPHRKGEHHGS